MSKRKRSGHVDPSRKLERDLRSGIEFSGVDQPLTDRSGQKATRCARFGPMGAEPFQGLLRSMIPRVKVPALRVQSHKVTRFVADSCPVMSAPRPESRR
jgi:hypothetical protein